MKAEIVSIGTELLLGEIVDTNSSYLASELPSLGIDLYYAHKVGDNLDRLVDVFQRGWSRADLILTSGGLGPTEDDMTRTAIAKLMGEEMSVDPSLEQELRAFFGNRSIAMPENNLKQAMLIPSSQPIANPMGTAPGWWVTKNGKTLVAMPGPPRELHHMWDNQVRPRLRETAPGGVLVSRVLKVTGMSEGLVDELAAEYVKASNPTLGVYAKPDGIHVRIAAKAEDEDAARTLIEPVEETLRARFGDHLWGTDDETMQASIGRMLVERGMTLATMESCTGGLLASTVTDVPGSSEYYKGGFITYTTDTKVHNGVDPAIIAAHGAVSAEAAKAMARAARRELGADIGIGITGVAGPTEQEGKPVGTIFVAVDHETAERLQESHLPGGRLDIKNRVSTAALFHLRQLLLEMDQR